jgi:hypothetical protein
MDKFKDSMGRWYTKGLFWEMCFPENKARASYTLKESEHKGLPSLKQLYLDSEDLTEYEFAVDHLGGWNHWKALRKCKWFAPHLADWQEELEVRVRSQGIKALISHSLSPKGQTSAKWLAEKGWVDKKRGAPSKAEVNAELKQQAGIHAEVEGDLLRLVK